MVIIRMKKEKKEFITKLQKKLLDSVKSKVEIFCMKNAGKFITKPVKDDFEEFINLNKEKLFLKKKKFNLPYKKKQ